MHHRTVSAIRPAPLECILGTPLPTDLPDSDAHVSHTTPYRLESAVLVATTPSDVAARQLDASCLQHNLPRRQTTFE